MPRVSHAVRACRAVDPSCAAALKRVDKERQRIVDALAEEGFVCEGGDETLVYGYHDPFVTPNFLRRNEVGVRVQLQSV